jgi:hypothetical protein
MREYVMRYNSARTRQDQVNADAMLDSKLTAGNQQNMLNDIRMSYSMMVELEQMEQAYSAPKVTSPETSYKDSTPIRR